MQTLSLDQIRRVAPSVFAAEPWERMSAKYRFFPTGDIVVGLMNNGFLPVRAQQSRSRIPGKEDYTRHMLRFRHASLTESAVNTEVPEIVLLNSHDGTATYQISLGLYRVVCTNGLVVKSAMFEDIRVRHSGRENLIQDVIEGSYRIIDNAPRILDNVQQWKQIALTGAEQAVFAESAIEVRDTTAHIEPSDVLRVRRFEDKRQDLWTTFNVVQENLTKGGVRTTSTTGQRRALRSVNSVDTDTKLNRALWTLTEKMASLKTA
jgi:hypothetical protein